MFVQLGCQQVLGFVSTSNKKALMFDLKLGFEPIAVIPNIYPGADLMILRLERKNCRWIPAELREAA